MQLVDFILNFCNILALQRNFLVVSVIPAKAKMKAMHQQLTNCFNTRLIRYRVRPAKENHALAALNDGFKSMREQNQQQEQANQDRPVAGCMVGQEPVSPRGQQQGRSKRA